MASCNSFGALPLDEAWQRYTAMTETVREIVDAAGRIGKPSTNLIKMFRVRGWLQNGEGRERKRWRRGMCGNCEVAQLAELRRAGLEYRDIADIAGVSATNSVHAALKRYGFKGGRP